MSNTQLYLSIGLPSLLIVLGFLQQNQRFNSMEQRIASLEKRIDELAGRFTVLESAMRGVYEA